MEYKRDDRVVLTLDAGGTKFSFSAMAAGCEIAGPVEYASHGDDLELCLTTIRNGFREILGQAGGKAAAISFAFPGPSYYAEGVIGDLGNLPAFRGGIPLGPMLSAEFSIPVFINNDGDLFALGEATGGFLPAVNQDLAAAGSTKRYQNLIGLTLGTGFGGGIVHAGHIFTGDNAAAGEVWLLRNPKYAHAFAEESLSIRALRRVYNERGGEGAELTALDVAEIARGKKPGNREAAISAFSELGEVLGECIANIVTVIDGLVVIGGGLANSYDLFSLSMMQAISRRMQNVQKSAEVARLEMTAFDLEDAAAREKFLAGDMRTIAVPGIEKPLQLDMLKRTGIGRTRLGTSHAVALGAYVFALRQLSVPLPGSQ